MENRPNIVFITTDHQRADSLGMVQCGLEVTPHINQLAKGSTVFTRAYNTCPLCVPARTALATGKYPTHNGVVLNKTHECKPGDHQPIHQMLFENGYSVAHSGVQHIKIDPPLEERHPFDMFVYDRTHSEYLKQNNIRIPKDSRNLTAVNEKIDGQYESQNYSNQRTSLFEYPLPYFKDVYFADQAVKYIQERQTADSPFALFVNIWAPHPPLTVPEPYASMFDIEEVELPSNVAVTAEGEPANRRKGAAAQLAEGLTAKDWKKAWSAHLGLTHLADECVGKVIQSLKDSGQYENTIILFMSDHGDHLGQHRMYQKMEMYEPSIKVPMIVKIPSGQPEQSVDFPLSHLDIVPTLLDLLDIERPDGLDGESLKPSIMGKQLILDRAVFSQYSGNRGIGDIRRAMMTRKYKYIFDPCDEPELYDLENDPLEMTNLARQSGFQSIISVYHDKLTKWSRDHGDWVDFNL